MLSKLTACVIVLSPWVAGAIAQAPGNKAGPPSPDAEKQAIDSPPMQKESASTPQRAVQEGLWPSPKLTELLLTRWADRISDRCELDTAQRAKAREVVIKRWSRFLKENRSTLKPLLNEFVEMRMELEPPPNERVQAWAERALPAFERFRGQVDEGTTEFRELLDPLQRAKFELQALELGVGIQAAGQRLKQWRKGEFDVEEFWEPPGAKRRSRRAERRQRRAETIKKAEASSSEPAERAEPAETDQIALELNAWEDYVETFIRVYDLDEGQRTSVLSCLSELKQRALAHRDRRRDEIARLEHRIQGFTGSEEERVDLKSQLTELYGPIDDMFKELKRRIEQVLTAGQRAATTETATEPAPDRPSAVPTP